MNPVIESVSMVDSNLLDGSNTLMDMTGDSDKTITNIIAKESGFLAVIEEEIVPSEQAEFLASPTSVTHQQPLLQQLPEFLLPPTDWREQRRAPKRKRKLLIDECKSIPSDVMKVRMEDTSDITAMMNLAPPTRKLMLWKETGNVDALFTMPGHVMPSRTLQKLFYRNMKTVEVPNDSIDGLPGFIQPELDNTIHNDSDHNDITIPIEHIAMQRSQLRCITEELDNTSKVSNGEIGTADDVQSVGLPNNDPPTNNDIIYGQDFNDYEPEFIDAYGGGYDSIEKARFTDQSNMSFSMVENDMTMTSDKVAPLQQQNNGTNSPNSAHSIEKGRFNGRSSIYNTFSMGDSVRSAMSNDESENKLQVTFVIINYLHN